MHRGKLVISCSVLTGRVKINDVSISARALSLLDITNYMRNSFPALQLKDKLLLITYAPQQDPGATRYNAQARHLLFHIHDFSRIPIHNDDVNQLFATRTPERA